MADSWGPIYRHVSIKLDEPTRQPNHAAISLQGLLASESDGAAGLKPSCSPFSSIRDSPKLTHSKSRLQGTKLRLIESSNKRLSCPFPFSFYSMKDTNLDYVKRIIFHMKACQYFFC